MRQARGADWGRMHRRQCAALPLDLRDGRRLVLMVTSRSATPRWIIPKGWAEPELAPHALAEREAFEEAGVLGIAAPAPIGAYEASKRLPDGSRVTCLVEVFPLRVAGFAEAWPEQGQRQACWFTPEEAAARVAEPELARLLRSLAADGTPAGAAASA